MFRPARLALVTACILACLSQPAFADRQDADAFSANVPDGWTMSRNEEITSFTAPDDAVELTVLVKEYDNPDINVLVKEWAGQTPVKMLDDNSYIYEDASGSRSWGMLAKDGTFVEIGASAAYDGIGAFLADLKKTKGKDGLAGIFQAAADKEVAAWLQFVTPHWDNAEAEDGRGDLIEDEEEEGRGDLIEDEEEEGTPYSHATFDAVIPQGWTVSEKGASVSFVSPDGGKEGFVVVRVLSLQSDDGKAFVAYAKEQAQKLEGKNIKAEESSVEFTTDKGIEGLFVQFGKKCLLLLVQGESPQINDLVKSIDVKE